jgi:hypothetical protein
MSIKRAPDFVYDEGDGEPISFWFVEMEATGGGWYHELKEKGGKLCAESGMGLAPWREPIQRAYWAWKNPDTVPPGVCL